MVKLSRLIMIFDMRRRELSISAIARKTGLCRKTIRQHLKRGWRIRYTVRGFWTRTRGICVSGSNRVRGCRGSGCFARFGSSAMKADTIKVGDRCGCIDRTFVRKRVKHIQVTPNRGCVWVRMRSDSTRHGDVAPLQQTG